MAVKCTGCGHRADEFNTPRLCPKCGGVMVPFVVKKEGKKTREQFLEKLED